MDDSEDRIDEDIVDEDEDLEAGEPDSEALEEEEVPAAEATPTAPPKDAADGDVESIEELIVKKEAAAGGEDDDSVMALTREDRLEPLAVKVVPPQTTEFVCKKCYLVKHRSQLKDKKRMLCRDCA